MRFDVISSGSKGNATLVVSDGHALLLDFGVSRKKVDKALSHYGLDFEQIDGFFLTHGHDDHASNVFSAPLSKVYASFVDLPHGSAPLLPSNLLSPMKKVVLGRFSVLPLPLSHDFPHTVGFVVSDGEESLAYVTDTGFIPEKDFPFLMNLDYFLLESNHDPKMLFESRRPDSLIRRIISDKGHLNNFDCGCYLSLFVGERTKECVLLHLSEECNQRELALRTVEKAFTEQLGYVPDLLLKASSAREETRGGRE